MLSGIPKDQSSEGERKLHVLKGVVKGDPHHDVSQPTQTMRPTCASALVPIDFTRSGCPVDPVKSQLEHSDHPSRSHER